MRHSHAAKPHTRVVLLFPSFSLLYRFLLLFPFFFVKAGELAFFFFPSFSLLYCFPLLFPFFFVKAGELTLTHARRAPAP